MIAYTSQELVSSSDFAKKFIKAIDVRTKKSLGKDYVLKHRDVIQIIIGK